MKLQFELLIVASLLAYASTTTWRCTDADWFKYKEEFKKSYTSSESELSHYNTYCDNIIMINQHNKLYDDGEKSYELEVTRYTDRTEQQVSEDRQRANKNRPIARLPREDYE